MGPWADFIIQVFQMGRPRENGGHLMRSASRKCAAAQGGVHGIVFNLGKFDLNLGHFALKYSDYNSPSVDKG